MTALLQRTPSRFLHLFLTTCLLVTIAVPGTAADGPTLPASGQAVADVDLDDVPIERALKLLAELYDVSIATGVLPETRVTVRLRRVEFFDAIRAVARVGQVEVVQEGAVYLIAPRAPTGQARQIVSDPSYRSGTGLSWLGAADVAARPLGDGSILLEGAEEAVQAAAAALENGRRRHLRDRVVPLGVADGEQTLAAVEALLEEGLEHVTYDATGHLLAVSAMPATHERVGALLDELTRSPLQYEIEVRVVEVARNALERMGSQGTFRLDIRGGLLPTTFPLEGLDDSARYFPSPNDLNDLRDLGGSSFDQVEGSLQDSGFRFGRIDARGLGLLIEFLEQTGEARVVATPRVTALDNRWARISMVTTLRIPTFTQNQAFATTTVTGIEEVDVGTELEVRPRKGERGEIMLTVTPEVSELEPTVEVFSLSGLTQGLPVVTRRRTETEVILESGETLVIGGLVRERETETVGHTPGLSKIPLIGRAFQHKGTNTSSSELLIFVTPRELPAPEIRRSKVRVDEVWIPAELARRVDEARGALAAEPAAHRAHGVRALEQFDAELLVHGLDLARDVLQLKTDRSTDVRLSAALFLLRRRPAIALDELQAFAGAGEIAARALATSLAPHLRVALAELLARSEAGVKTIAERLETAIERRDPAAAAHLLEALSAVAPADAARIAEGADGVLPARSRLAALGGVSGHEQELAAAAMNGASPEDRAFAQSALRRSLGRLGVAELLAGSSTLTVDDDLQQSLRRAQSLPEPEITEPALAWSGAADEIAVHGDADARQRVAAALDLLASRAPELRHLVGFAFATLDVDGVTLKVDPVKRRAQIRGDAEPERLAHQLVRLASIVFDARVLGYPAASERSLARAVRMEIDALERLTGAPCPPARADDTVARALGR